ncbi:hypothetical protein X551_04174 [Methylibium sp. T29]|nr:hypothetical protein X551_04174 [Methylibium sp. T29]EWS57638.1 hypothetical protein Y694_04396 [Methylibium sp. T29-B]
MTEFCAVYLTTARAARSGSHPQACGSAPGPGATQRNNAPWFAHEKAIFNGDISYAALA